MKKHLYLGLECPVNQKKWIHYPVIKILPKRIDAEVLAKFDQFTHFVFTSKSAVKILQEIIGIPQDRIVISVGSKTSAALMHIKVLAHYTAEEETAEGIIKLLEGWDLENAHFFWPHSSLSRTVLPDYLEKKGISYTECSIYDTVLNVPGPLPDLQNITEIMFTSPSTVDNFLALCPTIPSHIKLTAIGSVTGQHLIHKGLIT